jgi:putative phosphoesterase
VKRLALITDIHGNHLALKAVLDDIKKRGVDAVYCLGDLVGYAPFPNEVVDIIRQKGIPTLMGNYDDGVGFDRFICGCDFPNDEARLEGEKSLAWTKGHMTGDNKAFLRSLPEEIRIEDDGRSILLVHGSPRALNEDIPQDTPEETLDEIFKQAKADVLCVGHTHKPFYRLFKGNWVINAGSVGRPKHGDPNAVYCLLTIDKQLQIEFPKVSYDAEAVAKAILAAGLPSAFAEQVRTGKE